MDTRLTLNYHLFITGIPVLFIACIWALVNSPYYFEELAIPVTLDLVLTTPIIYYLLIRKKTVPKITVVSVFIISIIVASYIIPEKDQGVLNLAKAYALPLVELGVISFVLWKARLIYLSFSKSKTENLDFYDLISEASAKVLPSPVNGLLATEISVIYYSIIHWKKKLTYTDNEFTYHQKNGILSVIYAFMGLACIELFVVHMLIAKYNIFWAWVASGLTLYSLLQIFALIKSISRRPTVLNFENKILQLRYGFFSQVDIAVEEIKNIELSRKSISEQDTKTIALSPLGLLDSHNVILHLESEHQLIGLYGRKKKFEKIAFYIDEREKLKQSLLKLRKSFEPL